MNVLSAMFTRAEERGILSDLKQLGIRHRVSLYADDVVVFAKPCRLELEAVFAILQPQVLRPGIRSRGELC
jgi:hypothetical protein